MSHKWVDHPTAPRTCCDALGLDPAAVREQLDRIRPQSGVDRRFAGRGLRHGIRRGAPLTS